MNPNVPVHHHVFASMGTEVEMLLVGGTRSDGFRAFALARALADRWTSIFSRFDRSSELSRLNANTGRVVAVSDQLFATIDAAIWGWRVTGGLFDPTIHDALVTAGYDRPFSKLSLASDEPESPVQQAPGTDGIRLDSVRRTILLPEGIHLDLGGIAKGMYVRTLVSRLSHWPGGMISAGGDLQLWGTAPHPSGWSIGVENPLQPDQDVASISLQEGAVATSGTSRRTWCRGGRTLHHLIDPATGLPAVNGISSVTVVSDSAVHAEIAATALFVGGKVAGVPDWAWDLTSQVIIIMESGEFIELHPPGERYAHEQQIPTWTDRLTAVG